MNYIEIKVFSFEKEKIYNNKIIIEKNYEIDFLKKEYKFEFKFK